MICRYFYILYLFINIFFCENLLFAKDKEVHDAEWLAYEVFSAFKANKFDVFADNYVLSIAQIKQWKKFEQEQYIQSHGEENVTEQELSIFNIDHSKAQSIRNEIKKILKSSYNSVVKIGVQELGVKWDYTKILSTKSETKDGDFADRGKLYITLKNGFDSLILIVDDIVILDHNWLLDTKTRFYIKGFYPYELLGKRLLYAMQNDNFEDVIKDFVPETNDFIFLSNFIPSIKEIVKEVQDLEGYRSRMVNKILAQYEEIISDGINEQIEWSGIELKKLSENELFVSPGLSKLSIVISFDYRATTYKIAIEQAIVFNNYPYLVGGLKWIGK